MIIAHLAYKAPLEEIDKYIFSHKEFINNLIKNKEVLVAGPYKPIRNGGVIIFFAKNEAAVTKLIKDDPFYFNNLVKYKLFNFDPVDHIPDLAHLLSN